MHLLRSLTCCSRCINFPQIFIFSFHLFSSLLKSHLLRTSFPALQSPYLHLNIYIYQIVISVMEKNKAGKGMKQEEIYIYIKTRNEYIHSHLLLALPSLFFLIYFSLLHLSSSNISFIHFVFSDKNLSSTTLYLEQFLAYRRCSINIILN